MTVSDISAILPPTKLSIIRDNYSRTTATGFLTKVLPAVYGKAGDYNQAIATAFYGNLPSDAPSPARQELSHADRERCLIALLSARGVPDNLASHIYLGLMEGISVEEIAHVMMLAGMYSGVDRFTTALATYIKTLETLVQMVDNREPLQADQVIRKLRAAFTPLSQLDLERLEKAAAASRTSGSSRTG